MEEPGRVRVWAVVLGIGAALLGVLAFVLLPRGAAEFAYFPFDLAWPWGLGRGWGLAELGAHLLGPLTFGVAVPLLAWGIAPRLPALPAEALEDPRVPWVIGGLSVGLAAILMFGWIQGRPIVPDELSYAEQARQLLEGRLTAPVPAGYAVEAFDVLAPAGGGVTAKYLPGEALLQAPGVLVGWPSLLHLPLLGLALLGVYRAAVLHAGRAAGTVALGLIAFCPMLLLVTGTGLSHVAAFAAVAVAAWGEALSRERSPWLGALLVGVAVGTCGWIRPQVAVPVGGVLLGFTAWHLVRRSPAALVALLLPPALAVGAIAAYNLQITGSPLELPWSVNGERWGFGNPVDGLAHWHGPGQGVQNVLTNALRFSTWWIGWPSAFVLLWLFLRVGRPLGGLRSWAVAGLAQIVFMVPYFAPGIFDVGPIYHLEAILAAAALGGCAWLGLYDLRPRFAVALAGTWLVLGTLPALGWGAARLGRLLDLVHDESDRVIAELPDGPALLLVDNDCTERLGRGSMMIAFPRRSRLQSAQHVFLPRPEAEQLPAIRAFYGDRPCFYAHRDPATGAVELLTCEGAASWLERPTELGVGIARCPRTPSYAEQAGLRPSLGQALGGGE